MKYYIVVVLFFLLGIIQAQNSITGTIIGKNGIPLSGATIIVSGTTSGVITDTNGNFNIKTNKPYLAELHISAEDYPSKTVKITNPSSHQRIFLGKQKIKGFIYGKKGKPLSAATIMIRGTTIGTVSDTDGSFTIQSSNGFPLKLEIYAKKYKNKVVVVNDDKPVIVRYSKG